MWVKVPFTYTIPNFCDVEFKEKEFWYNAIKHFKGDQRLCPAPKNVSFSMNYDMNAMKYIISLQTIFDAKEWVIETRFDIPVRVEEGEYKCIVEVSVGKKVELCAMMFGEVHEVL